MNYFITHFTCRRKLTVIKTNRFQIEQAKLAGNTTGSSPHMTELLFCFNEHGSYVLFLTQKVISISGRAKKSSYFSSKPKPPAMFQDTKRKNVETSKYVFILVVVSLCVCVCAYPLPCSSWTWSGICRPPSVWSPPPSLRCSEHHWTWACSLPPPALSCHALVSWSLHPGRTSRQSC